MGNMNILSPLCLQKLQNALPPFPLNSKIDNPYSPLDFFFKPFGNRDHVYFVYPSTDILVVMSADA